MQSGSQVVSVRGEGAWSGMTTLTTSERGDRRLSLLENCYVNVDGSEIRSFPGMRCAVDLQTLPESRESGYRKNFVDAMRPAFKAKSSSAFLDSVVSETAEKLLCWTNPTRFHSFNFVRGRLQVIGESDFRKEPILSADGVQRTISSIEAVSNEAVLTLSGSTPFTDYGFNTIGRERPAAGFAVGNGSLIYIEGIPAKAGSNVDTRLNNKFHYVKSCDTATNKVTILTTVNLASPHTGLSGSIWRCRPGTSQYRQSKVDGVGYYEQPVPVEGVTASGSTTGVINVSATYVSGQFNGWTILFTTGQLAGQKTKITATNATNVVVSPVFSLAPKEGDKFRIYAEQYYPLESYSCDDPDALTSWTLIDKPNLSAPIKTAYQAQVANRIRDWGGTGLLFSGTSTVTSGTSTLIVNQASTLVPYSFTETDYHIYAKVTVGATTQTLRVVGAQFVNAAYAVASGGSTTTITLTGAAFSINSLVDRVVVNTGTPSARRRITANGANTITINAVFSPAPTNVTIYDNRITLTFAENLTVNGAATIEIYSLGRQEGGERRTDLSGGLSSNTGPFSFSRRRQKRIPYRTVPAVSGDRLLIAAPGYGCVFQAPSVYPIDPTLTSQTEGIPVESNDRANTIRCVGVPKAVLQVDLRTYNATYGTLNITRNQQIEGVPVWTDTDDAASYTYNTIRSLNNYAGATRGGSYSFAVAYKDQQTGEVGLLSEPMEVETDAVGSSKSGITLRVLYPGYMMSETAAYSLLVYRSAKNDTTGTLYFMGEFQYGKQSEAFIASEFGATGPYTEVGTYPRYEPMGKYGLSIAWPTPVTTPATSVTDDNAPAVFATIHNIPYVDDTTLAENETAPPVLNQMPRGAKAVRTIRGWTFYGGSQGNCGENGELLSVGVISAYQSNKSLVGAGQFNWLNEDELATKPWPSDLVNLAYRLPVSNSAAESYLCAQDIIPPSYAGLDFLSTDLFPYPAQTSFLDRMINIEVVSNRGTPPEMPYVEGAAHSWPRWNYLNSPFLASNESFSKTGKAYLRLPRGRFQVSEQGFPSVVPATNTGFLDNENDDDIEAIGQYGGQAILCSRLRTYTVGWSGSPITDTGVTPPEIASPEFGCIAANSMVEFDGGLAWISDRGPVAMTGEGVQWIGRELASDFFGQTAKYKRDSLGLMRHSWACHDPERGLVYFGLFTNRNKVKGYKPLKISFRGTDYEWDTAPDDAKSFFPCDEVLVWSYRSNAWSIYNPPARIHPGSGDYFGSTEILWMSRGPDSTGTQRVYAMLADGRIYALIDENNDANSDALTVTADVGGSTVTANGIVEGTFTVTASGQAPGQTYAKWAANAYIRAGMEALVMDATGTVLKGRLAVKSWNQAGTEIVLWALSSEQGDFSWSTGDKVLLGVKTMRMTTNYLNIKGHSDRASVRRIGLRYSLRSNLTTSGTGEQVPLFAKASAKVNKRSNVGTSAPNPTNEVSLSAVAVETFDYLGKSHADDSSRDYGFTRALPVGQEFSLSIETIGAAQIAVQDVYAEVS